MNTPSRYAAVGVVLAALAGQSLLAQGVTLSELETRLINCKAAEQRTAYCNGMIMGERLALARGQVSVPNLGSGGWLNNEIDCPPEGCGIVLRLGGEFNAIETDLNELGTMTLREFVDQGGELRRIGPTTPRNAPSRGLNLNPILVPQIAN